MNFALGPSPGSSRETLTLIKVVSLLLGVGLAEDPCGLPDLKKRGSGGRKKGEEALELSPPPYTVNQD